jgi:hypothetical protein
MRPSVMHAATVITRALWVRFHVALILTAVVVVGVLANAIMLRLGLRSLSTRYALDVLVGYASFFFGVKLWLRYAETALPPRLKHDVVRVEDGEMAPEHSGLAATTKTKWWEHLHLDVPDVSDGEGCLLAVLVMLAFVALLVLLGVGVYLLAEAPALLGEAFVQAALAGALRRGAKRMGAPHWSGTVLRSTWIPAALVLVFALLLGYVLQHLCPTAARLVDALFHCPT